MKELSLLMILLLLFTNTAYSMSRSYYLLVGNGRSWFRHEGKTQSNGMAFGAGIGWEANNSSRFGSFINVEAFYVKKQGVAENKIWRAGLISNDDYKIGDINMSIGFLELPLKFGYFANISKRGSLGLFYGTSLSVPIVNNTRTEIKDYIYYDPEKIGPKVDYERDEKDRDSSSPIYDFFLDNLCNTSINGNFGALISWTWLSFEMGYSHAFSDTKNFINLTIRDKVDTFYMVMRIKL